jgi:hypothetical protein
MERVLSAYFNTDRVYLAVFEPTEKGIDLAYINSTDHPVNPENMDGEMSLLAQKEFGVLLGELPENINKISVCLPTESVFISQIPGNGSLKQEEIKQLLHLEIRQTFPQYNNDDFISRVYQLAPRMDGKQMLIVEIIPKSVIKSIFHMFSNYNFQILNIDNSQFNAHNALLFNYPEESDKAAALLSVQSNFIDISVLKNGEPLYYNLVKFNDKTQFAAICEEEFGKLMTDYIDYIENAYFFGSGLNSELFETAKEILAGFLMTAKKLNSFRMISTGLPERYREYCARTAHIFPPCIGAAIPGYVKPIYK